MAVLPAGLTPPPFWWLLALACLGQGLWTGWIGLAWLRREPRAKGFGRFFFICFLGGAALGIAYGIAQHDAVFVLGQGCALLLGVLWHRAGNRDGGDE